MLTGSSQTITSRTARLNPYRPPSSPPCRSATHHQPESQHERRGFVTYAGRGCALQSGQQLQHGQQDEGEVVGRIEHGECGQGAQEAQAGPGDGRRRASGGRIRSGGQRQIKPQPAAPGEEHRPQRPGGPEQAVEEHVAQRQPSERDEHEEPGQHDQRRLPDAEQQIGQDPGRPDQPELSPPSRPSTRRRTSGAPPPAPAGRAPPAPSASPASPSVAATAPRQPSPRTGRPDGAPGAAPASRAEAPRNPPGTAPPPAARSHTRPSGSSAASDPPAARHTPGGLREVRGQGRRAHVRVERRLARPARLLAHHRREKPATTASVGAGVEDQLVRDQRADQAGQLHMAHQARLARQQVDGDAQEVEAQEGGRGRGERRRREVPELAHQEVRPARLRRPW
ncbi:hypothetical protein PTTG_28691 [Puccinia triticina 1-1 BBBD Race 1]|uniref:Uncharacterized protein n=1 Tax=Puccinia triticina (isolate 1-1 / race 1 (BBBD)) TaxID=630390 RepID=A0A180G9Z9_PUCT1|nr:hypothetical protein PTTG_28691 [Puccinia triticina 1-1 BBBD Race 1]